MGKNNNLVAGAGLEPATPLWEAPAYETGEIPTSRPCDFM